MEAITANSVQQFNAMVGRSWGEESFLATAHEPQGHPNRAHRQTDRDEPPLASDDSQGAERHAIVG